MRQSLSSAARGGGGAWEGQAPSWPPGHTHSQSKSKSLQFLLGSQGCPPFWLGNVYKKCFNFGKALWEHKGCLGSLLNGEGNCTPLQYLAWKIPWTEEPGRLKSTGSLRVGHDWATSLSHFTFMHWRRKWQPTPVFLPGESQGRGSLVGCRLGSHRVGQDWRDLAAAAAAGSLLKLHTM